MLQENCILLYFTHAQKFLPLRGTILKLRLIEAKLYKTCKYFSLFYLLFFRAKLLFEMFENLLKNNKIIKISFSL